MPDSNSGSQMLTYRKDPAGLIMEATIPNGTPLTTTLIFAPGALVTSLDDSKIYRNSGTSAAPVWDSITTISSDEIDYGLIRTVTVPLTAAQINGMYAAPVLVLAGVTGKSIFVDSVEFRIARTATQFAGGGTACVQYDSTVQGAGTATTAVIAAAVITAGAGTTVTHRIPVVLSDVATTAIEGKGLYFSNLSGAFTTGTGTASLIVRYHIS